MSTNENPEKNIPEKSAKKGSGSSSWIGQPHFDPAADYSAGMCFIYTVGITMEMRIKMCMVIYIDVPSNTVT